MNAFDLFKKISFGAKINVKRFRDDAKKFKVSLKRKQAEKLLLENSFCTIFKINLFCLLLNIDD